MANPQALNALRPAWTSDHTDAHTAKAIAMRHPNVSARTDRRAPRPASRVQRVCHGGRFSGVCMSRQTLVTLYSQRWPARSAACYEAHGSTHVMLLQSYEHVHSWWCWTPPVRTPDCKLLHLSRSPEHVHNSVRDIPLLGTSGCNLAYLSCIPEHVLNCALDTYHY